jgi:glycosyltransferase involved in cell wall biosynthesis
LAVLNSHPVQYFAPLYRRLAREPQIELMVYYCSRQGAEQYLDVGFGQSFQWDIPLLEGYPYKFLPNLRHQDRVGGFFSLVNYSLVDELRKQRYDALWVNGHMYLSYMLGIALARASDIPVLMRAETHLLLQRSLLKRALRQTLMRFFYNCLCSACLPIGSRNREFYLAHGVPRERLFTVPYTVDNEYFIRASESFKSRGGEVRAELGLPVDRPLILFASKLVNRKRPQDLIAAFQRLYQQGSGAALALVGSGDLEHTLRAHVAAYHLPDVFFFGFRNQSELPKFYAVADVFVLPSEDEPWGLVINEAMCAGLPIVASQPIGAVADLVKDGYNGFTFPVGDVVQLAAHLATLLSDASLRKQMGANSLALIRLWDLDSCVEGVLAALRCSKQASVG